MTYEEWTRSVDRFLVSRQRGVRVWQIDPSALAAAYQAGTAPINYALQPNFPPVPPPPPPPPPPDPRARQTPAVLNDPRYQVDTGLGRSCPACGSTNIVVVGKPGTGLGYFGSIGFVLAASLVESAIQSAQKDTLQCGFCQNVFA